MGAKAKKEAALIPWANPRANYQAHCVEINQAIGRVLNSNSYIGGAEVNRFEEEFADYVGAKYAIGTSSGLDALILSLQVLGVGRGDEVITVAMTAPATIQAIKAVGATPVCVDIDPIFRTMGLVFETAPFYDAITKKTKAVIPVHLYGSACLCPNDLAFPIIEDCAQATGHFVAKAGILNCFSFYPTKNLGAIGDGGMITTNDAVLAMDIKQHRSSHRLDPIQAAILRVKLPYLDEENQRRRDIAERYNMAFDLPSDPYSVYHLYVIEDDNRDQMRKYMADRGINCGIHYATPAMDCDLPITKQLCRTCLSLPMYPELTNAEVERVIECVLSWSPEAPVS